MLTLQHNVKMGYPRVLFVQQNFSSVIKCMTTTPHDWFVAPQGRIIGQVFLHTGALSCPSMFSSHLEKSNCSMSKTQSRRLHWIQADSRSTSVFDTQRHHKSCRFKGYDVLLENWESESNCRSNAQTNLPCTKMSPTSR